MFGNVSISFACVFPSLVFLSNLECNFLLDTCSVSRHLTLFLCKKVICFSFSAKSPPRNKINVFSKNEGDVRNSGLKNIWMAL
jgi:hypothetical protein